jgi:hypothetical protein
LLQFVDDETRVAVYIPADGQDGDATVLNVEFLQDRSREAVEHDAVEVGEFGEGEVPVHLTPENADVVGEEDYWWVGCHCCYVFPSKRSAVELKAGVSFSVYGLDIRTLCHI